MKLLIGIFFILALLVLVVAFWPEAIPASDPAAVGVEVHTAIVDYGSGVYYFSSVASEFANSLAGFIKVHPQLEVVTIASDDTLGVYGRTQGYFVVCKEKSHEVN